MRSYILYTHYLFIDIFISVCLFVPTILRYYIKKPIMSCFSNSFILIALLMWFSSLIIVNVVSVLYVYLTYGDRSLQSPQCINTNTYPMDRIDVFLY
jgi:hypothetical protein